MKSRPILPTVICSSVIRSSQKGDSHGGLYLIDLEEGRIDQVLDWDDDSIEWDGRGGDRGLRGIAFYANMIFLAASDEILIYSKDFEVKGSIKNRYLKHCHEIFVFGRKLFITSTGFDSVLEYDLESKSFEKGYHFQKQKPNLINKIVKTFIKDYKPPPQMRVFNPNSDDGPLQGDTLHINNVYYNNDGMFVSGTNLGCILRVADRAVNNHANVPYGVHNAFPFKGGIILNDTSNNRIALLDKMGRIIESYPIKTYPEENLVKNDIPDDHARQGFGRGLCIYGDLIIVGSSPATISVYRSGNAEPLKTFNITMDIRNSIHGLEIWPFGGS